MAILNNNNNYLKTLVDQGNDAHSNLYLVHFVLKTSGKNLDLGTVRCDGFTPPTPSQDSYTVKFLNVHIDRPRAKVRLDKFFDLTFRVDGNYQMYKVLKDLQGLNFNENSDVNLSKIGLEDIIARNLTVSVEVPGIEKLFEYENCWIESVTPVAFKQGTSEPVKVTSRINYLTPRDYQTEEDLEDLKKDITVNA